MGNPSIRHQQRRLWSDGVNWFLRENEVMILAILRLLPEPIIIISGFIPAF